jgi:hypothetical protein
MSQTRIPDQCAEQIAEAYRRMATEALYRPMAPSDGFGNITVPVVELDLEAEERAYVSRWWAEEDALEFRVGCCDFRTRPATIFAVEAARQLCGGASQLARLLLRMAADDLERQE